MGKDFRQIKQQLFPKLSQPLYHLLLLKCLLLLPKRLLRPKLLQQLPFSLQQQLWLRYLLLLRVLKWNGVVRRLLKLCTKVKKTENDLFWSDKLFSTTWLRISDQDLTLDLLCFLENIVAQTFSMLLVMELLSLACTITKLL